MASAYIIILTIGHIRTSHASANISDQRPWWIYRSPYPITLSNLLFSEASTEELDQKGEDLKLLVSDVVRRQEEIQPTPVSQRHLIWGVTIDVPPLRTRCPSRILEVEPIPNIPNRILVHHNIYPHCRLSLFYTKANPHTSQLFLTTGSVRPLFPWLVPSE